jgi:hypothetical protein
MTLFRRSRFPSPPEAGEEMPPRPQAPPPLPRLRGAMVIEGPREVDADPCGSGPKAAAGSKNGATT